MQLPSPDATALATAGLAYLTHLVVAWLRRRAPNRVAEVTRWAQLAAREAHATNIDWQPIFQRLADHLHLSPAELELARRVAREVRAELMRADLAALAAGAAKVAALFPTTKPSGSGGGS